MGRFLTQHIAARKINACDNMTINLLQQRCKNLKPVQSCENVAATNVALKVVCRRYVTRIDFLCNNIAALKMVNITLIFYII